MLTVAYVGFGVSVREYHIPYVESRDDIRIKYVFRRKEDIAQFAEYEPFYPEITFTADFNDVLRDSEVNLVVVSAPDKFHIPYAYQILGAGKHALIEKPFAPTAAEARACFELAKSKGLICMPNQNRRFDADFLAVKKVVESGKLGDLVRLESHYDYYKTNGWYDHLGTLYNLGVHTVDQFITLLGMPDRTNLDVRSIHHPGVGDDYYDLEFFYGNCKASVSTSMCVLIDYNIAVKHEFYGHEIAGIKLHAAIDTQICHNYIHHCSLGTWLDWQAQGTRVSENIYYENNRDLMVEVTHGPYLVDGNIFCSPWLLVNAAQGGAYIHNLICGFTDAYPVLNRATPYHLPHSTQVLGTALAYGGDDRWIQNLFVGGLEEGRHYGTALYNGSPVSLEEYLERVRATG